MQQASARAWGLAAVLTVVGGCAGPGGPAARHADRQQQDAYLARFVASAEYSESGTKLASFGTDIPAEKLAFMEAVFRKNTLEILRPLVPFARTFDGKEYPEVRVEAKALSRQSDEKTLVFQLTLYGTLRPRETPVGTHGMRPLLDESYLCAAVWDVPGRRVKWCRINGGQLRAVPPAALARAREIAAARDARYGRRRPERVRWLPAWGVEQVVYPAEPARNRREFRYPGMLEDTGHNIVMLTFILPGEGDSLKMLPFNTVAIDLALGRVVGMLSGRVDASPRYDPQER